MAKEVYEKPKMTFVSLHNQDNVAEKCWGNHGTGFKYYDTVGAGYVAFTIAAGSCTADDGALLMYYYEYNGDPQGEQIFTGDPRYDETYSKIMAESGGSYGQPFKGGDQFPNDPGGMS